jgi:flagellar biosynthesis protein FlhG
MISRTNPCKVISFCSGKGGVGKTTLVANLALYLANREKKVLIFDGDLGLSNVDIFFGRKAFAQIHQVLMGQKNLREVIIPISSNLDLISSGSGVTQVLELSLTERRSIFELFLSLERDYDFLLIDTGSGIHSSALHLSSLADYRVTVLTPDPAAFTDNYAFLKLLYQNHRINEAEILVNQVSQIHQGLVLFNRFLDVAQKFSNLKLSYLGSLEHSEELRKGNYQTRLVMQSSDSSAVKSSLERLGEELINLQLGQASPVRVQEFWSGFLGVA